jgi:hypothetical protein
VQGCRTSTVAILSVEKSPQFLSKQTPLQQITLQNFSTSFLPSLQLGTHRNLSSLVLFFSNKNQQTSFPVDPLSLSLTNSITTQPAKLIDPKEVQIFPPPNATKG